MIRLSQQTQQIIRDTVREVFGVEANVKLFGSRINEDARGGDIDLLVELPSVTADIERKTMQLIARLQLRIGDQPIDVLVLDPSTPRQSIHEQASITGIKL
jgi:predicted nucleotidyltransferase